MCKFHSRNLSSVSECCLLLISYKEWFLSTEISPGIPHQAAVSCYTPASHHVSQWHASPPVFPPPSATSRVLQLRSHRASPLWPPPVSSPVSLLLYTFSILASSPLWLLTCTFCSFFLFTVLWKIQCKWKQEGSQKRPFCFAWWTWNVSPISESQTCSPWKSHGFFRKNWCLGST